MQKNAQTNFIRTLGMKLLEWREDYARTALPLEPWLLNYGGMAHGGVLVTLMDATGGMSGCFSAEKSKRRSGLTVSLTTNFVGQKWLRKFEQHDKWKLRA